MKRIDSRFILFIFIYLFVLNITNISLAANGTTKSEKRIQKDITRGKETHKAENATSTTKSEKILLENIVRHAVSYKAENLRDPFGVYLKKEAVKQSKVSDTKQTLPPPPPRLTIQGIVWGRDIPLAIINNKVVKVGDTIEDGVQIIDISKEGIIVLYKNQKYNFSSPAAVYLGRIKKNQEEAGNE